MAFVPASFFGTRLEIRPTLPQSRNTTCALTNDMKPAGMTRRTAIATLLSVSAALVLPEVSLADHTYAAARRSLDRYYPRILAGLEMLKSVKQKVVAKDASTIGEITETKLFDIGFRRALSIYATSFSDNYLGQQSKNLLACVDGMYSELSKVKAAADQDDAVLHYNRAVLAIEKYFLVARLPTDAVAGLSI